MSRIKFYGSQVGGKIVTTHSYTESPLKLLRHDIVSASGFYLFFPFIIWPLSPYGSRQLCELYPSLKNLWCIFLHLVLFFLQAPFLLSIPFWAIFPLGWVVAGVGLFLVLNRGICYLLNGAQEKLASNPKYAAATRENAHERWIFLNGVAVGKHWLQSNIDRLALTFRRPIEGIHNPTAGILFDVLQCLIQRNFNYATEDIRSGYGILKETLYDPKLTKVIFILHSQGAIEGGMIIDWLLQEVPQDLLAKLEVYTFGNAANHFNNPHLHLLSQHAALDHPTLSSTTKITAQIHYHDTPLPTSPPRTPSPVPEIRAPFPPSTSLSASTTTATPPVPENHPNPVRPSHPSHTRSTHATSTTSTAGKTLRYIEHYAQSADFVARWGVLHYACNPSPSLNAPRFMGRVFERAGQGHQFNQHYLDTMFPLKRAAGVESDDRWSWKSIISWFYMDELDRGGIGGSGFIGAEEDDDSDNFMNEKVEWAIGGDEAKDEREGVEMSYLGAHGEPLSSREKEVLLRNTSPVSPATIDRAMRRQFENGRGFTRKETEEDGKGTGLVNGEGVREEIEEGHVGLQVRDLSRLWLYVNGNSPHVDEVDVGIARMATI